MLIYNFNRQPRTLIPQSFLSLHEVTRHCPSNADPEQSTKAVRSALLPAAPAQHSPLTAPRPRGAHLHAAQNGLAPLPHVAEGTALGQHQEADQRLAQPVADGGSGQPGGSAPGSDALAAAEHGLPDVVQRGGAGGGVAAAEPVPAQLALPLLHGAGARRLLADASAAPARPPHGGAARLRAAGPPPRENEPRAGGPRRMRGGRALPRPRRPRAQPLGLRLSRRGAGWPLLRGASSSPPRAWRRGEGTAPALPLPQAPAQGGPLNPPHCARAGPSIRSTPQLRRTPHPRVAPPPNAEERMMDAATSQSPSSAPSRRTNGGEERQSQQGGLGCVVRLRGGPAAVGGAELRVPGGNATPGGAGAAGAGWGRW